MTSISRLLQSSGWIGGLHPLLTSLTHYHQGFLWKYAFFFFFFLLDLLLLKKIISLWWMTTLENETFSDTCTYLTKQLIVYKHFIETRSLAKHVVIEGYKSTFHHWPAKEVRKKKNLSRARYKWDTFLATISFILFKISRQKKSPCEQLYFFSFPIC